MHPLVVGPSVEVRALRADPLREPSVVREIAERFLLWDAFVSGRRRVESCPLVLSPALHHAAVRAAEDVVRAVGRAAARAHVDPHERALYGFDDDTLRLAAASRAAGDDASLMRVDLLLGASGTWKACEINADCPGGHNETLALPRLARTAGFTCGHDPTFVVDRLAHRLDTMAGGGAVGILHATGYAEDLQVCAIVRRALEARGVRALVAAPTAPTWRGGHLCLQGEPVRALYRYFPTEWASLVDEVRALAAGGEAWIAQRFVEQQRVATPFGPRYLTLGVYVLDGVFAGYFARVTPESHASHDALCVPVFVGSEA